MSIYFNGLFVHKYVYGKNKNEEKTLIGAKVLEFDGEKTYVQEIYVGLEFSLRRYNWK